MTARSLQNGLFGLFAAATFVVIVYYGVFFTGQLPDHRWVSGWNDVLLHAAAFAVLTGLVVPLSRSTPLTVIALAVFAALIELSQIPMARRSASLSDLAASIAGIGLALLFIGMVRWTISRLFETKPDASRPIKTE